MVLLFGLLELLECLRKKNGFIRDAMHNQAKSYTTGRRVGGASTDGMITPMSLFAEPPRFRKPIIRYGEVFLLALY